MSVIQQKEYRQNRGVTVSGYLKPVLAEIATAGNKMMLLFSCTFEEKKTLDNDHFYIDEMKIENPFTSSNNLLNSFADSPPFLPTKVATLIQQLINQILS